MSNEPGTDDSDDHWLEDHAGRVLAGHDSMCIALAMDDALAHGTDPDGARQVAAQFLEDGDSACRCMPRSFRPDHG